MRTCFVFDPCLGLGFNEGDGRAYRVRCAASCVHLTQLGGLNRGHLQSVKEFFSDRAELNTTGTLD